MATRVSRVEFEELKAQVQDHESRITWLEGGPVDPGPDPGPDLEESPDGTEITTPGFYIFTAYSEKWELTAGAQIIVDGNVLAESNGVVLLLYYDKRVYQSNAAGGWWSRANMSEPWRDEPGDPRLPEPPVTDDTYPAPLGAYLTTWFGHSGSPYYSTIDQHAARFQECMGGRLATTWNCPGTPYPSSNPDFWPVQTQYNLNSWPACMNECRSILVNFWYVDAAGRTLYSRATDGTTWNGGDLDHWIRATLDGYVGKVDEIIMRPAWEYNINFMGQGIDNLGDYLNAMNRFHDTVHAWGDQHGIRIVNAWNTAVFGQRTESSAYGTVEEQMPKCDAIMADFYAWGGCLCSYDSADEYTFTIPRLVRLAQKYGKSFGFCELGDGDYQWDKNLTANVWLPDLVNYMDSLRTMNPPVPINVITLWDIETVEWSPPEVNRQGEIDGWNAALGANGSLMTIRP